MATASSIRVEKTSEYKGGTRTWSNRYHFVGGSPPDTAHWATLSDNVVAAEALALSPNTTIVKTTGFIGGSDLPIFDKLYNTPGSVAFPGTAQRQALEVCALVRWSTPARSVKNHPIYLFSYIHDVATENTGAAKEALVGQQHAALVTYADKWKVGFSDGSTILVRSSENGATANGSSVHTYVSHRDFP